MEEELAVLKAQMVQLRAENSQLKVKSPSNFYDDDKLPSFSFLS
jgi:hypothetical protein